MEDVCPHRLAPLSEGRLHEDGTLQCSYHGWQIDCGGCTCRVPQIGDSKAQATACGSGRSLVAVYPSQVCGERSVRTRAQVTQQDMFSVQD